MKRSRIAALLWLLSSSGPALAQCEAPAPVRRIIEKADLAGAGMSDALAQARTAVILQPALAEHPGDYFLLRRLVLSQDDASRKLAMAAAARDQHPGSPVYQLIYADALIGHDTREAKRLLEALAKTHPELARSHYVLASLTSWGKYKETERSRSELEAFLEKCPAPFDAGVVRFVSNAATPAQVLRLAGAVRKRLEKESGPWQVWESLWRAEFKARPPAEHAALRQQILRDLAALRQSPPVQNDRYLEFLRDGYQSAGDPAAVAGLEKRILERHPSSTAAKSILDGRWRKEHPFPKGADQSQSEAWYRASLRRSRAMHQTWPEDSLILNEIFTALARLPDTSARELELAGAKLLEVYRRNPNWYGSPPVEFRVAAEYSKRRIALEQVPALIEEGYRSTRKRHQDDQRDDRLPPEVLAVFQQSAAMLEIERARVELACHEATGKNAKAQPVEQALAGITVERPYARAALFEVKAHAAELLGRKLDALLLYRAALDARQTAPSGKDELAGKVNLLWKELGGTDAAWGLFREKKVQAVEESRWERPVKPLPEFALHDLEGKTWALGKLAGKAVLINLWAVWCGPCRAEHPEFQKLYEQLKDRPDVAVLSFNIDTDIGKVAPYMKENKYSFPVLLANEPVHDYLEAVAIPQNWFLDRAGKLQWIQTGYGGDPKWRDMMIAKLDEVRLSGTGSAGR